MSQYDNNIIIVSSTDNKYAQHLGVMLTSLALNKNKTDNITLYILSGDISSINIYKLATIASKYHIELKIIKIDKQKYIDLPISEYSSHAAYLRLLIPDLISKEKRVIYLDSDIIVCKSLIGLWNSDLEEYSIGAVLNNFRKPYIALNMKSEYDYFNSGVMLMDIDKCRKNSLTQETLDIIRKNPEKMRYWDESALNIFFNGKWKRLPSTYNTFNTDIDKNNTPHIIHFSGPKNRPWLFETVTPNKILYYKYLIKTPWKFYIPPDINYLNIKIKINRKYPKLFFLLKNLRDGIIYIIGSKKTKCQK